MLAQLHSTDNGAMDYIYCIRTRTSQDERLRYFYSVS